MRMHGIINSPRAATGCGGIGSDEHLTPILAVPPVRSSRKTQINQ